jgi:hypothetical protein
MRFYSWAYYAFPMRYFYVTCLDAMLTAQLNIKTFIIGDHIWGHYMESSWILSCLYFLVIFLIVLFLPCYFCRLKKKHGVLPLKMSAA